MEEKNCENKVGGRSIKFLSSPEEPQKVPKVMPLDKRRAEFALSMLFSQLLLANGYEITKIELNENDENKGADTILKINGINKGVQITKLVLNDSLKRKNVALKRSMKFAEQISNGLKIDFKLNVVIYPPRIYENEIPLNRAKLDLALANKVKAEIEKNIASLKSSSAPIFCSISEESLKKIASTFTLNPIPEGHYPLFPGKENVFVNYEIDCHFFTHEEMVKGIDSIYNQKNKGKSEILLIWADTFDLLYQDAKVYKLIEQRFAVTSFEDVYFLTFFDRMDVFSQSIKLYKIEK